MILKSHKAVPGLNYLSDFITPLEKTRIQAVIAAHPWCDQLKRKQQYYGIKYFQTKLPDHILQPTLSLDHQPLSPFQFIIDKCIANNFFRADDPPNQILVNKYIANDRLGLHVEDVNAFGDVIVGISIGSTDYLRLASVDTKKQFRIELQDRSCYVLSGEARFRWRHGIGRVINDQKFKLPSFQRISLTVRHVIDSRRRVPSPQADDIGKGQA